MKLLSMSMFEGGADVKVYSNEVGVNVSVSERGGRQGSQ